MNRPQEDMIEKTFLAFFTPPYFPIPEAEMLFASEAEVYEMDFLDTKVKAYEWGKGGKESILLVHGWGGRGTQMGYFVKPLLEQGFHVIAFDGTGHYDSGSPKNTRVRLVEFSEIIQLFASKYHLKAIIAHSMGAGASILALDHQAKVEKVVFLGIPRRFEYRIHEIAEKYGMNEAFTKALKNRFEQAFGESIWEETSTERAAAEIKIPALFFHAPEDAEVPFEEGEMVARIWGGKAQMIPTPGLGHTRLLRDEGVIQKAIDFILHA